MTRVALSQDADAAWRLEQAARAVMPRSEMERRLAAGRQLLAYDDAGAPIGRILVTRFPLAEAERDVAWIGQLLVLPEHRSRRVGRALVEAALDLAKDAACVELYATEMGRPLYEKAGFVAVGTSHAWARDAPRAEPVVSARHSVHPISLSEAMEIGAFDATRFGARRLPALLALQHAFPWSAFMSRERATGEVSGFILRNERRMGPLVAQDDEAAAALLSACEQSGAPTALVVHDAHEGARRALAEAGYAPGASALTRMRLGAPFARDEGALYGLATWSSG